MLEFKRDEEVISGNEVSVDILPECLIQKILCYLSFKKATKMSVLSKTWLQAWSTLPNLKFDNDLYISDMKIVDNTMERYEERKIPIEKFELPSSWSRQVLLLIDKWIDIALQNGVKDLVLDCPLCPLPIFKILAAKSLRELVLSDCNLMHVSLSSGVPNCHSLRKLSLINVRLDGNTLQTLLNSCPLIVNFIFEHCSGLEKIELNLQKIKSISIKTRGIQTLKIQIPTLELSSISRSQYMKVLKIEYCGGIQEIDPLNLVSLEYNGDQIPKLKIARESCLLKQSKIILDYDGNLNAAWFGKLRKFLSNSTSWSHVSLYFDQCEKINMKYFQLDHIVATPQVDILDVNIRWPIREYPTFVDALLWSCHPRRLNLHSNVKTITCFMDRLMYMKNSSNSTSHSSKPWHRQLQEVKAYRFDSKNPVDLRSWKLAQRNFAQREKLYFLLDW